MKKLTTTLLVAVLTVLTTTFAQIGQSRYFTVTNKTTNETLRIPFSDFEPEGDKAYTCKIKPSDFKLGFCLNDKITFSYGGGIPAITPRVIWGYSFDEGLINLSDTSLSTEITIRSFTPDGQDLYVRCSYQEYFSVSSPVIPALYTINVPNVHNDVRFYSEYSPSTTLRVVYKYYKDVCFYLTTNPYVTVTDVYTGATVFKGYMNDNGVITFDTKGRTGIFLVSVTLNNVTLPAEKIYLW